MYHFFVWLHVLAAAVWLGGMVFLVLVLVPVVRRQEYGQHASRLVHLTGTRFRAVGWICLGLLAVTGLINLWYRGIGWAVLSSAGFWASPFGSLLGWKLLVVAAILALSACHDFLVGPRATAAGQTDPGSAAALRLRRRASWMGRVNLLLALAAVAFGVMLVRGAVS